MKNYHKKTAVDKKAVEKQQQKIVVKKPIKNTHKKYLSVKFSFA